MSENASIQQSVQIGVQTGSGSVPATRRLRTMSVSPNVTVETAAIRTNGDKFAATVVKTKEWSTVNVEGTPDYRELAYILAACVGNGTESVNGSEHTQVWETNRNCPDTLRPLTVERGRVCGDAVRTEDVHLAGFTLAFRRSDGSGTLSADGFGKPLELNTTLTGNQITEIAVTGVPTSGTFTLDVDGTETAAIDYNDSALSVAAAVEVALGVAAGTVIATGGPLPANPVFLEFAGSKSKTAVTVALNDNSLNTGTPVPSVDTAAAAADEFDPLPILAEHLSVEIDGTPQTRVLSAEIALSNRHAPVWYLDQDASWASTVETEPTLTVSLLMAFDDQAEALVNMLRTNGTDVVTITAGGPITSGVQNTFEFETPFAVEAIDEFSDEDGVYAISLTLRAIYDNGGPTFTLINTGVSDIFP